MTRQSTRMARAKVSELSIRSTACSQKENRLDLHQTLPPIFARRLEGFLQTGDSPLAALSVAQEDNLGKRTPARALVLTTEGVLFMEEGETVLLDTLWGVKSLFYPYSQITAVGIGAALLTGRFTLHGTGNAPPCEITLPAEDLGRFDAVAKLIGEKIAAV